MLPILASVPGTRPTLVTVGASLPPAVTASPPTQLTSPSTPSAAAPSPRRYEGWRFVETDTSGRWHKHVYDHNLDAGVQGKFNQIIYPLLNIWESFGDKNISGE